MRLRLMKNRHPRPPEDVRAVLANGTVIPLEMAYLGVDDDGQHLWRNVNLIPTHVGTRITVEALPGRTTLWIDCADCKKQRRLG
jgi:hypothetical protein